MKNYLFGVYSLKIPFRQPLLAGLAIAPDGLHLVQLAKRRQGFHLEKCLQQALPPGLMVDGKIADFASLQMLLREFAGQAGIPTSVATCLPANLVRVQCLDLPSGLSEADCEAEIILHLQRELPGMTERLCLDFHSLFSSLPEENKIQFVAARYEYVSAYQACLAAAGWTVRVLEVDIFSIIRAVLFAYPALISNQKYAILRISSRQAVLAACKGDEVLGYQHWEETSQGLSSQSLREWLAWCGQAYQRHGIQELAVCGEKKCAEEAGEALVSKWNCRLGFPDFHERLTGMNEADLIACGLAMREAPAW